MKNKNTHIRIGVIMLFSKQRDYRSRGDHEIDPYRLHHIGYLFIILFFI